MSVIEGPKSNVKEELKWISSNEASSNSFKGRTLNKFSSNPIVPLGALLTVGVLGNGLYNFYKGDKSKQQKMMRYRCLAQGVTILAASVTIFASGKFFK